MGAGAPVDDLAGVAVRSPSPATVGPEGPGQEPGIGAAPVIGGVE
jgi:hypothetical protein